MLMIQIHLPIYCYVIVLQQMPLTILSAIFKQQAVLMT